MADRIETAGATTRSFAPAWRRRVFSAVAGIAVIAGAEWLRAPQVGYLIAALAATLAALILTVVAPSGSRWRFVISSGLLLSLAVVAARGHRDMSHVARGWPGYRTGIVREGSMRLSQALPEVAMALAAGARQALDARDDGGALDAAPTLPVVRLPGSARATVGVAVYRAMRPTLWSGRIFIATDSLRAPLGIVFSPFYVTMYATAERDGRRAVATAVLHAEPPGDHLSSAVDAAIADGAGLERFELLDPRSALPAASGDGAAGLYAPQGRALLAFRAIAPAQESAALRALEQARRNGAALVALAMLAIIATAWRRETLLLWRLVPLGVALATVAILPLNTFSSATVLFNPAVYFVDLPYFGTPLDAFTASVGALMMASGIVLLGLLMILRARLDFPSRWVALAIVLAMMGAGPFLLRDLASGVTSPPDGVTAGLWLAWEMALFLAAAALLVGAAAAGGAALGGRRGLPPWLAPALATIAAVAGPVMLRAPAGWPEWYPVLWIAAIGALALTRRHRAMTLAAASCAALGATTLTWNAAVRGRVTLANRDVAGLSAVDPTVTDALARFGRAIGSTDAPETEADLLKAYVRSDLVNAGYPMALSSWGPDGLREARITTAPFEPPDVVERLAFDAHDRDTISITKVLGDPGTFTVMTIPHRDGGVTSVAVGPRTRLIPEDPFSPLLGLERRTRGGSPYALTLTDIDPAHAPSDSISTRWNREGTTLHGDRLVRTARGLARAHLEVEMRSLDVLVQRGTLVVMLDLVALFALWLLSVIPDGAFGRWLRWQGRRWASSFRARLTVVLFAFFVIPATAFAAWSYGRLQLEDRQAREILVTETLRAAAVSERVGQLGELGRRLGTPLFVYRDGEQRLTSEPLFSLLSPVGRFLPPAVHQSLDLGREIGASADDNAGSAPMLFGYYAALGPAGDRIVLGAPARGNDEVLDQRRRDLGVLLLFSTVVGAILALWLSGFAARSLAEPIGRLREAALAIAGGEREPPLAGTPPVEFVPVFSAFRRMAADLGESRTALEAAQRRTSAVLRNVASGVIAFDRAGRVTLVNPRAESLLPSLTTASGGVLPAALALAARDFLGAVESERDDEREFETTIDERQVQVRLTRLTSGAGGAVMTLDDVTDLARAQRVLAWGEMARQVAHEIKNPLTPIRLGVQHLLRARADARADFDAILDRNVERILAEIDRLDEIARSFSRYGSPPAERAPAVATDVAAIARDVVELEKMGRSDVDWSTSGADAPAVALARGDELREVLLNVLENARHAEAKEIRLLVHREDSVVVIEVADDGRGIPAQILPRIFEPHFSTSTSGSGLGLAISRQIVEAWGGSIAISSREGHGTGVRIVLKSAESPTQ